MILPTSPTYSKSMEFWHEDGDIVLEAEDTVFRPPAERLTRYSPVFREILSFSDQSGVETFDGCPMVHLLGDSATDVAHFLRAENSHCEGRAPDPSACQKSRGRLSIHEVAPFC